MNRPLRLIIPLCLLLTTTGLALKARDWFQSRPDPTKPKDPPWFLELGPGSGLDGVNVSGDNWRESVAEQNGQGVALLDYDGDGWLDVFQVNGATVGHVRSGSFPPDRLYRNNGDGTFSDITNRAGIGGNAWGMGAAAADYDGDGDIDIYVTNLGPNYLWRNNGDGTFTELARDAEVAGSGYSSSAAWGDLNGDGLLDIFVSQYCVFDPLDYPMHTRDGKPCWDPRNEGRPPVLCGPDIYDPEHDVLYLNLGKGRFADASDYGGIRAPRPAYGMGVALIDVDLDGQLDIFVANDSYPAANHLFINLGDGRLEESGRVRGVGLGADGTDLSGMGVAVFDFENDGRPDLGVTNFFAQPNSFYHNLGRGFFEEAAMATHWAGPSVDLNGWGIAVEDFDHDGLVDCLSASGHIWPPPEYPHVDPPPSGFPMPLLLLAGRPDRTFRKIWPLPSSDPDYREYAGRGLATGDLDNDGDLDAVLVDLDRPLVLLVNEIADGRPSLTLRLEAPPPNTQGIGARVKVEAGGRTWWRYACPQQSYQSSRDPRLHVGLDNMDHVDRITVHWPDGSVEEVAGVQAGAATIRKGVGLVEYRPHAKGWR